MPQKINNKNAAKGNWIFLNKKKKNQYFLSIEEQEVKEDIKGKCQEKNLEKPHFLLFKRSIGHYASKSTTANTLSTAKELWKKMSSNSKQPLNANAELLVDFVSNKMNKAWIGLEKAPEGSFKNKLHGSCDNIFVDAFS
ncbi:hypothetical protein V6Z12_D02G129200 [Gossypium hirsutum]